MIIFLHKLPIYALLNIFRPKPAKKNSGHGLIQIHDLRYRRFDMFISLV